MTLTGTSKSVHEELKRLREENAEMIGGLRQALGQWKLYAEMADERDLATEDSYEGDLYRKYTALLNRKG